MQPFEPRELDNAAFELARQLERLAKARAAEGDIFGVAFICKHIQSVSQLPTAIARRFPKGL